MGRELLGASSGQVYIYVLLALLNSLDVCYARLGAQEGGFAPIVPLAAAARAILLGLQGVQQERSAFIQPVFRFIPEILPKSIAQTSPTRPELLP